MKPILNNIKGSEQNAFDWTCFTEYSARAIFSTKRGHIVAFIRKGKSQHANFQLLFFFCSGSRGLCSLGGKQSISQLNMKYNCHATWGESSWHT